MVWPWLTSVKLAGLLLTLPCQVCIADPPQQTYWLRSLFCFSPPPKRGGVLSLSGLGRVLDPKPSLTQSWPAVIVLVFSLFGCGALAELHSDSGVCFQARILLCCLEKWTLICQSCLCLWQRTSQQHNGLPVATRNWNEARLTCVCVCV